MTDKEFERLNVLADKAINEAVTVDELKEFNQLLTVWNEDVDLNLLSEHHGIR